MTTTETTTGNHLAVRKTVGELAALVGGRAVGDESFMIEGAAGLTEAGPRDISFLGNPKYAEAAMTSKAGCLFLPPQAEKAPGACQNRILVEDPQWAFAQVLKLVESQRPKAMPKIDEKASVHYGAKVAASASVGAFSVVEKGAQIGEGTVIMPQVYVGEGVRIGKDCKIYPRVVIREDCVIGDRVIIQPGAVIGGDGYGFSPDKKTGVLRKIPQLGNVVIGDDVEIQSNTAIDRGTVGSTVIGANTKVDNLVQIGHNCQIGKSCLLVSQTGIAGSTTLGNGVITAGQAGLVGHIKIGDRAIISAQAGVMADVEPGKVLFGSPGRPHREAFKLQALYGRLPELFDAVKEIKKKLGITDSPEA
jgi:UDP-3-O-[3-hydroxymyristoyl] glucosamine N-acyltransferase